MVENIVFAARVDGTIAIQVITDGKPSTDGNQRFTSAQEFYVLGTGEGHAYLCNYTAANDSLQLFILRNEKGSLLMTTHSPGRRFFKHLPGLRESGFFLAAGKAIPNAALVNELGERLQKLQQTVDDAADLERPENIAT